MVFIKKNVILVLLFSLIAFLAISTSFAADLTVSDVDYGNDLAIDNNVGVLIDSGSNNDLNLANGSSKTFKDIQDLIDDAEVGGIVKLENTTYYGSGDNIVVLKELTIDGNGATLDAQNLSRIFEVSNNGVVFKNINFINGNALAGLNETEMVYNGQGGAIYFNIDFTTIDELISSEGYVYDCRFENNTAYLGGAVYLGYITNSTFVNNFAYGGGASTLSSLLRCTFINNTANECGGALLSCVAYNCLFDGNRVKNGSSYILEDCDESTVLFDGPFLSIDNCDIYMGEVADIKAKLEDSLGNPLVNETIYFYFEDGSEKPLSAVTDSEGIAHLLISDIMDNVYGYGIANGYVGSSNIVYFEVNVHKMPVTLIVNSVNGTFGQKVTLIAEVRDINGNIVKNENVYFNGKLGKFIDDKYVLNYTCDDVGNFSIPVEFESACVYENCETTLNLSVMPLKTYLNISVIGNYYKGTKLNITLCDCKYDVVVNLIFSNNKSAKVTLSNGVGYYDVSFIPGSYNVTGYVIDECLDVEPTYNVSFNIVKSASSTLTVSKLTTTYNSGKTFNIAVKKGTTPLVGVKLKLKVYTGSTYKWYYVTTDSDGVAKFKASTLGIGTHKVIVYSDENSSYFTASSKTNSIVIKKAATTVTAPKVTNKYGKTAYFKVTVKNKATGKVISGLTIKIKVYNGSKVAYTYTVKTDANGVAKINTNKIKKGTHKVNISSSSAYYTVSYTAYSIVIK